MDQFCSSWCTQDRWFVHLRNIPSPRRASSTVPNRFSVFSTTSRFWNEFAPEMKSIRFQLQKNFISCLTNLFGIFSFVEKVEFDRKILLRLFHQPLELKVREQPAHDLHAIFHRGNVNRCISAHIMMLHLHGDFLSVLQGRSMNLSQTCNTERLRIEWDEKLRRLKREKLFVMQEKVSTINEWITC